MHCNLMPRQSSCSLITMPCPVWSRWTCPLLYYSAFAADTLLYADFDLQPCDFDLWPWTRTFAVYCLWRDETLFQTWTQASNTWRSYCAFGIWPSDLEHCVMCCIRLWDNFHKVSPVTTCPCLNYSISWCWYVMSRCDLDLWPIDLESLWCMKHHMIKVCMKFEQNRAIRVWIINNFCKFCHWISHNACWPDGLMALAGLGSNPGLEESFSARLD